MRRRALIVAVMALGATAAIAAEVGGFVFREFENCRPLRHEDERNIALRVTLPWGFEGLSHYDADSVGGGPEKAEKISLQNSWKLTVYGDQTWMISRGRTWWISPEGSQPEVCIILRGTKAHVASGRAVSKLKADRLTP